ncbi:MAG: RNA 2',3'-cyclic phosphodiesterase [Candidatus Neomarinimicrobiota bacterium]
MSEKLIRTFISVNLPRQIVNIQSMLQSTVHNRKANIKWVKPGNIHFTLKFIGHTPPDAIDNINAVIQRVSENHTGMKYLIKGTGCFPVESRPRVLWVGIDGQLDPLLNYVAELNNQLEKLGFPTDERDFRAHITLARIKYPPKISPDITGFISSQFEPLPFEIHKVNLISSELFPHGPIYSILGTHFLSPKSE